MNIRLKRSLSRSLTDDNDNYANQLK